MKERVSNRYKFINSPLKKFNEMQMNGGGSYLSMMQEKRKMERDNGNFSRCKTRGGKKNMDAN